MKIEVKKLRGGQDRAQFEIGALAPFELDNEGMAKLLLALPVDVEVPGDKVSILVDVENGNLCLLIGKGTIEIQTDSKFRDRLTRALTASHDYQTKEVTP